MSTKPPPHQDSPFPTSEHHDKAPATPKPLPKKPADAPLDHGIEESFPASDPVSVNVTKIGKAQADEKTADKKPAGQKPGDKKPGDKKQAGH